MTVPNMEAMRVCSRCVMDTRAPDIHFDADGVCNYCHMQDKLERLHPIGDTGWQRLEALAVKIRHSGRNRNYDCVVGVSGGRDSSYCLYIVKKLGLRPLAVHFDNGWDSEIAKTNISQLCAKLQVDLHTIIADWEESRDLTNCTIRACVPYIDVTDDVGIASALYRTAAQERVPYILLSHSFREEGITPLKWNYVDGRYIRSLVRRFSTMKYRKFKNIDFHHLIYWHFIRRIRVINITNYYDDRGTHVERMLKDDLGIQDTGQHHFDNELFALVYFYAREKFGFDWRVVELSARVRTGVLTRAEALGILAEKPFFENPEMIEYCLKKQGISQEEFEQILRAPNKYFTDYPTWYPLLKLFRVPIRWMCRADLLPGQAYEKFFEA